MTSTSIQGGVICSDICHPQQLFHEALLRGCLAAGTERSAGNTTLQRLCRLSKSQQPSKAAYTHDRYTKLNALAATSTLTQQRQSIVYFSCCGACVDDLWRTCCWWLPFDGARAAGVSCCVCTGPSTAAHHKVFVSYQDDFFLACVDAVSHETWRVLFTTS